MIVLGILTATALACRIDEPNRPLQMSPSHLVAPFDADSIRLSHICGNRFRVQNANDFPAEVHWDVVGSTDTGRVILPPRPAGKPFSEVFLTTNATGTTRLFYQAALIETTINLGTPCPPGNVVPAVAPDTIPRALIASLGTIEMANGRRARPDLLVVVFRVGTTQAAKQAAIDAVRGIVVGGRRFLQDHHTYYVLVPAQRSDLALLDAFDALRVMPQVSHVEIIYLDLKDEASYRKPNDGAGFLRGNWRVRHQDADSVNWALESIDAPLAWGCEVGSTTVRVGVVDLNYATGTEVDSSIVFPGYMPNIDTRKHGLRVASVLGTPGNNGRGFVGVMWKVSIDYRDYFADPNNYGVPSDSVGIGAQASGNLLSQHLIAVGTAGAVIINLSRANLWTDRVAPDTSAGTAIGRTNRAEISSARSAVRDAISFLASRNLYPLFIISAGNDGLDAVYSGYNQAKLDYPNQVIVVGGSKRGNLYNDAATDPSNYGALVDIYAPGDSVAVMLPNESVGIDGGTSFGAPLVAGTAGLLKSFDPRAHMTAAEMKALILAGAIDSVTEPSPSSARKPILNAYGALTKAAEHSGAPLCGSQRVYGDYNTGNVRVQRIHGDTTSDETLGSVDPASMNAIFAKHGGKSVQLGLTPAAGSLIWTASGWTNGTPGPNDGGIIEQFSGGSHNGDSSVVIVSPGSSLELRMWKPGGSYDTLISPFTFPFTIPTSGVYVTGGNQLISPVKPLVYIASGIWRQSGTTESYVEVYPLPSGPRSTIWSYSGKLILNMTVTEDGSEARIRMWNPTGPTCEYEFRSLAGPDSGTVRRTISGTSPPALGGVYCRDDATSSPRIVPTAGHMFSRGRRRLHVQ